MCVVYVYQMDNICSNIARARIYYIYKYKTSTFDFINKKCTRALVAVTNRAELVGKGIQLQMIIITDRFNFSMQIGYWLVYILGLSCALLISLLFLFMFWFVCIVLIFVMYA